MSRSRLRRASTLREHTNKWAAKIASFDGYVVVTPEYNRGTSGALKNAIDFIYAVWNNKAAGFVSYGSAGGVRAVELLRLVMDGDATSIPHVPGRNGCRVRIRAFQ